jgi:predicted alpha/beta-hydrolase family hydrolase
MEHPFMSAVAHELAALGISSLRYQFPYMEKGGKRPDPPALCHATVRAAVDAARALEPAVPLLLAGGKSFGARMTSQAQASAPLHGVRGLIFLGFPLHPPKQPSDLRAQHLERVLVPMLFIQGTRDEFAQSAQLAPVIERLGGRASFRPVQAADHSFHVPARTGRVDAEVRAEWLRALAAWVDSLAGPAPRAGA